MSHGSSKKVLNNIQVQKIATFSDGKQRGNPLGIGILDRLP